MGTARLIQPGSAIAAACFALLSVWRLADGQPVWAVALLALALAHVGLALRGRAASKQSAAEGVETVPPTGSAATNRRTTLEQQRRGWIRITVAGLVLSCLALLWFPPLSLLLAGASVYAAHQARRCARNR